MTQKVPAKTFEDLAVWQKGIALVKEVYLCTEAGDLKKDFGLKDQLRRAVVSIPTNIAEGYERASRKEYLNFLNIAKGSAGEVRSLLCVASEIGYLEKPVYEKLRNASMELSAWLSNQIKALRVVIR